MPPWMKPRYLLATLTATVIATSVAYQAADSGPANTAPVMSALDDVNGDTDAAIAIECACTDDGLPASPGAVSYAWSQTAGTGTCTFLDDTDPTTTVTCDTEDDYTIECECSDGELTDSDTLTASVTDPLVLYADGLAITPNFCFSVSHQLRAAYAGDAYEAQRQSDDATQAIGFDVAGEVDTAALATFCAGDVCSVRTLYDNVGACDVTQTTEANQPIVYTGDAVVVCGTASTPCMLFDGTDYLTRGDSCGFAGNEHVWIAFHHEFDSAATDRFMVSMGTAASGTVYGAMTNPNATRYVGSGLNGNDAFLPDPAATTWASHILEKASGATYADQTWETNGVALTLSTGTNETNSVNMGTTLMAIGALVNGSAAMDGWLGTTCAGDDDLTGDDLTHTRTWFTDRN